MASREGWKIDFLTSTGEREATTTTRRAAETDPPPGNPSTIKISVGLSLSASQAGLALISAENCMATFSGHLT